MNFDPTIVAAVIGAVATITAAWMAVRYNRASPQREAISADSPDIRAIPLSPGLEDALALAENQSRREGKDETSTRHFFAAVRRLNPEGMQEFLQVLASEDALPDPISEPSDDGMPTLRYDRPFSACMTESLRLLGKAAHNTVPLGTADVFVDVSMNGHGKSVRRLRDRGFTKKRIDEMVISYRLPIHTVRPAIEIGNDDVSVSQNT